MKSDKKRNILIVEDEVMYSKLLKTKLEKEGFNVTVAHDGDVALEAMHQQKPDIVLLDLIMPTKDGFQLLTEMKQDKHLKNITVIVLSNLGQEEDIKRVKSLGVMEYLVKSNVQFIDAINKVKHYLQ